MAKVDIYIDYGYTKWAAVLIADSIVESSGYAKMPDAGGKFRIVAYTSTGGAAAYGNFVIHCSPTELFYTISFDNINPSYVGQPVELSIFVKYTK